MGERLNDFWNVGYGLEANAGLVLTRTFTIQARAGYNAFELDESAVFTAAGGGGTLTGGSATIVTGTVNVLFNLIEEGSIRPYLLFGLGYYGPDREQVLVTLVPSAEQRQIRPAQEDRFGALFGAGLAAPFSRHIAFTVEARFVTDVGSSDEKLGHLPVTFGLQFF